MLMDSFDLFPLSCIINSKFIAIHGGISPDLKSVNFLFNFRLKILKN
jgi:serine/threonine-protein phosphatase 2B catalytic subunit